MDSNHQVEAKRFLVLSKKKFQDRHRGNLSRSRSMNLKQKEVKSKVRPSDKRMSSSKRNTGLGCQAFIGLWSVLESWVTNH
jgi:hypothetical protein